MDNGKEQNSKSELPTEVSFKDLSPEALEGIISQFILREGTDYGIVETNLQLKIEQVLRQIKKGDVKIYFDHQSETVGLQKKV